MVGVDKILQHIQAVALHESTPNWIKEYLHENILKKMPETADKEIEGRQEQCFLEKKN